MVGACRTLGLVALAISFTLETVSARKCPSGFYSCLKLDIHRALRKIEVSDNYTLLPGLGFERTGNFTEAPLEGQKVPALGDLIGQTEALFKSHALYWNFLPGVELRIAKAQPGDFNIGVRRSSHGGGRTFGVVRRLKMALLPIMYKLGVITTLLTMLTVFALKSLAIGVVLLVLATGGILAKLKHGFHGHHHHQGWDYPPSGWGDHYYGGPQGPPHKEVHIHLHGQQVGHQGGGHYWHRTAGEPPTSPTALADMPYTNPGWKYMGDYSS